MVFLRRLCKAVVADDCLKILNLSQQHKTLSPFFPLPGIFSGDMLPQYGRRHLSAYGTDRMMSLPINLNNCNYSVEYPVNQSELLMKLIS